MNLLGYVSHQACRPLGKTRDVASEAEDGGGRGGCGIKFDIIKHMVLTSDDRDIE